MRVPDDETLPRTQDEGVTVHGMAGCEPGMLADWLSRTDQRLPGPRAAVGASAQVIVDISGPATVLGAARRGLPDGAATAEAIAVRLRRAGRVVAVGEPVRRVAWREWTAACFARGRDSVAVARADPTLCTELQVGSWWEVDWKWRMARRAALVNPPLASPVLRRHAGLAGDVAFWRGVRSAATHREWRRFTASSYVVLCYHRLAGEMRPGQERMDYSPRRLRHRIRLLRILGWRPLEPDELVDFHNRADSVLPRRRFVLSVDDAFADAVQALSRLGWARPQVFAVTGSTGGTATWLAGEPVADWHELAALGRLGGVVGSHAEEHISLLELEDDRLLAGLVDSLRTLRDHLSVPVPMLAYPHGRHDRRVRAAAVAAGYEAAYTTRHGRNGAGTDPFCLRRMQPKQDESVVTFLWQVLAGEKRPPPLRKWIATLVKQLRAHPRKAPRPRRGSS